MPNDLELNFANAPRRLGEKPSQELIEALVSRHPLLAEWRKLWEETHGYRRAFVMELLACPRREKQHSRPSQAFLLSRP